MKKILSTMAITTFVSIFSGCLWGGYAEREAVGQNERGSELEQAYPYVILIENLLPDTTRLVIVRDQEIFAQQSAWPPVPPGDEKDEPVRRWEVSVYVDDIARRFDRLKEQPSSVPPFEPDGGKLSVRFLNDDVLPDTIWFVDPQTVTPVVRASFERIFDRVAQPEHETDGVPAWAVENAEAARLVAGYASVRVKDIMACSPKPDPNVMRVSTGLVLPPPLVHRRCELFTLLIMVSRHRPEA